MPVAVKENKNTEKQPEVYSGEEMYDKYSPLLFSIIAKIIPDNKEAEESLLEVFSLSAYMLVAERYGLNF